MGKTTFSIRIPDSLYRVLKNESEKYGFSINVIITMKLMDLYKEQLEEK